MYFPSSYIVLVYICTLAACIVGLVMMALRAAAAAAAATESGTSSSGPNQTKFFGSQIGGQSIINYSYTVRFRIKQTQFVHEHSLTL